MQKQHQTGFSLVELSIVLVILGLLTGGILGGQSLMHAAELRSVMNQLQQYQTAVMTFQDKYFALPGDMPNATKFWGDNTAFCSDAAITDGTTCNGDGDGFINAPNGTINPNNSNQGSGGSAEKYQFWNHLALAGLIEGSYTGIDGGCDTWGWCAIAGQNTPASKPPNSVIDASGYFGAYNATISYYTPELSKVDRLTIRANATSTTHPFSPEDAWNIDNKLDDGKPAKGKLRTPNFKTTGGDLCTLASSDTDYDANYALTASSKACAITYIFE